MLDIRLIGSVDLVAAAADGKPPTFTMTGYSGDAMTVANYGRVVIDGRGIKLAGPSLPVLRDHDPAKIVGHSQTVDVNRKTGEIALAGTISGGNEHAAEIVASGKAGFPWAASVGAQVEKSEFLESGAKATVNGRQFAGPLQIVRACTLREISFVAAGADANTSATIAAKSPRGMIMTTFDEWLAASGYDVAAMTDQQRTAIRPAYDAAHPTVAKGREHGAPATRAEVDAIFARYYTGGHDPALEAARENAVSLGLSPRQAELAMLLAARGTGAPNTINTRQPIRNRSGDAGDVITASLLVGLGMDPTAVAKHCGERVTDAAVSAPNRGMGLQGAMRRIIQAAGGTAPSGRFNDGAIRDCFAASRQLQASGYSTIPLPGILSNAANKLLLESFSATSMTWPKFCRVGSNVDFKAASRYRLTGIGEFSEVAPGGEIKHISLTESDASATLGTHGAMLTLTRQSIINDDLSAFAAVPKVLGRMSAIAIEKKVFTKLLANASSFFGTANANYESGGGSALASAGLLAAYKRFKNQTDANGDPTMQEPAVLLVPPALDITARQLMNDVMTVGTTTANVLLPAGNPWAKIAEPVAAPYLGTAFSLTGASNTGWYLLAGPGDFAVLEVSFLDGRMNPSVETGELDFNKLGYGTRAYHDFAVSFLEHRGGVFSAGA